jgi:large subunit ribosomal protein L15
MKLNELKDNSGATKNRKRVGRGIGSGTGKTAGRGHKGQKSRSGVSIKGFEGGQMPINRRLPKRGFTNANRVEYSTVNTGLIQKAITEKRIKASDKMTEAFLVEKGLARKNPNGIKLLAKGELKDKITIEVTKASKGAEEAVTKAGGKLTLVKVAEKPAPKKKADKKDA